MEASGRDDDGDARASLSQAKRPKLDYGTAGQKASHAEHTMQQQPQLDGIRCIEAVARTWTKCGLVLAYVGYDLLARERDCLLETLEL